MPENNNFATLKVTSVEVHPFAEPKPGDFGTRVLADATVVLADQLCLRGVLVKEGQNGLFVGYPSDKSNPNCPRTLVFPMMRALREEIENTVIEKYQMAR